MRTIWKYELEIIDEIKIEVPTYGQLLKIAEQDGKLCLWAEVNPNTMKETLTIRVVGTGHSMEEDVYGWWHYLDSVVMSSGAVWHVYYHDTMESWKRP